MTANLDMNSNRILNLPAAVSDLEPLRLTDLDNFVNGSITFHNLPTGGTINQLLTKQSSSNYDAAWSSNITASAITCSSFSLSNLVGGGDGSTTPHAFNSINIGNYNQSSYGLYVQRTLNGTWLQPQTAITTLSNVTSDPSAISTTNDVVSSQNFARGTSNVTLARNVNLYGGNDYTEVLGTGYQYALGREIDVGIQTGGTAVRKYGLHINSFGAVRGSDHTDKAINIVKFTPSASAWDFGLTWGIDAFRDTSYILGSSDATTAFGGIDFTNVTFNASGHAFKSLGFKVNSAGIIYCLNQIAPPAGGSVGAGLNFSTTANFGVFFGSGVPTLSAAKGSLYLRTDGSSTSTRMYVNTDAGTTWTNCVTAA